MSDDSPRRVTTLRRRLVAMAAVGAVSLGGWVLFRAAGGETWARPSPPSQTRLDVQPGPGECANGSQGLISVPLEGDAPRTPAEALVRAQLLDSNMGTLTPYPGDPTWGERLVESGRRVAAARAVEFPRLGGGTGWFVMETAFVAPCGYVNPRHRAAAAQLHPRSPH